MLKKLIIGLTVGVLLFLITTRDINWGKVILPWTKINPLWLLPGLAIFTLGILLKTRRWLLILNQPHLSFKTGFSALCIGYLVNNILPARLGEVARIYLIGRREKVGISKTIGSIIAEKILDTLTLISILVFLIILLPVSTTVPRSSFFFVTLSGRWKERFEKLLSGFRVFRNKRSLFVALFYSLTIWVLEGFWNYSLLRSLNIQVPLPSAFFLAVIVNLGLFLPSPPGYLGVFHFLTTFALVPWGVEKSQALSFAFFQHTIEYLILTSLGIYAATKLSFNPFKEKWQNT